jgi:hypothetical protein
MTSPVYLVGIPPTVKFVRTNQGENLVTRTVIVDSRENRDGLLGDIDTSKDSSGLRDTWQTLMKDLGRKMAELQEDVVLFGTDATALTNLNRHGAGDDIARSQILSGRSVTFHETFTLRVQQISSLATRT